MPSSQLHSQVTAPAATDDVLQLLATIATYRVGIGGPADLPASLTAAGKLVEAMPA